MAEPRRSPTPADAVTYVARLELRDGTIIEGDSCRVRRYELSCELHEPYELDASLWIRRESDDELTLDPFAAADFTMAMHHGSGLDVGDFIREWHGVVLQATYVGTFDGFDHVRVQVGPAMALLRHSRRSRVFQARSIPDVAESLLTEAIGERGRKIEFAGVEDRDHPPLDYLVQYQESDLEFVQRILAEAGLTFTFRHHEDREVIVVLGSNHSFVGAHVQPAAQDDTQPAIAYVSTRHGPDGVRESVARIERTRRLRPRTVSVEGWDWKNATPTILAGAAGPVEGDSWAAGELFVHDVERLREGDRGDAAHRDDTGRNAQTMDEREAARADRIAGEGNLLGLDAGTTIELTGHTHPDLDGEYLATRVVHRGDCPQIEIGGGSPFAGADYENAFEAQSLELSFRPRRRPKPRVLGPQTAVVVGPKGEEIHTDELGRVQVRLRWDREQRDVDAGTSCWLRVAQMWAGPGWGTLFLPRIGMEVVVSFLDGDPDRPMVIGSVYNGRNTPPYPLPEERTKSTIKTQSSPGGDGHNELRFEDAAGAEEVYVHAQRDLNEVVERAHTQKVGHTQSIRVERDQSQSIGGNRTVQVGGEEQVVVGTPPPADPGAPAPPPPEPATQSTVVHGSIATKAHRTIVVDATESLTLRVGETSIAITPAGIALAVAGGCALDLTKALQFASAGGQGTLGIDEHGVAELGSKQGGSLRLDEDILAKTGKGTTMKLDDKAFIEARDGARVEVSEAVEILARRIVQAIDGDATKLELSAGQATLASSDVAELEGGSGGYTASTTGLDAKGPKIDVQAAGLLNLSGAITKINE